MIFESKVKELYKKNLFSRADKAKDVGYFTSADFDGMREVAYSFTTSKGDRLVGAFYSYEGSEKGRIVVFDHGMSQCGHRAYMREIDLLCKRGYTVFSYDHTGCADSEGSSNGGFSQSLCDLDACLCALKNDEDFKKCSFSVVGHSWGAYSCLNIGTYHPDVKHIVAMSGFISVKEMHKQLFPNVAFFLRKAVYGLEFDSNPGYVDSSAIDALMKTKASVLIIHSDDDKVVKKSHFDKLKKALRDRENTEFLLVKGKAHNPNYTRDAVLYLGDYFSALIEKRKNGELSTEEACKKFLESFDFWRMTEQDPLVFEKIFETLEK